MPFVNCPECGKESSAPRDLIGLEWDCPHCGESFVVREDGASVPVPVRRRRKQGFPVVAVVGICVLATVAALVLVATVKRAANPPAKVVKKAEPREEKMRADPLDDPDLEFDKDGNWVKRRMDVANIVVALFLLPIYLAPSIIALLRRHNNLPPIIVVNVLLGCFFIGWVVALAWSLTDLKPHRQRGPV